MGDLNQEIKSLKDRIKLLERISTVGLVGCGVAFIIDKSSWIPYLVTVLLIAQIYKSVSRRRLKRKEYLAKEVEERTREIRSERDAVQKESEKLAAALEALAEAQDELVRQERMATVGQLTKGLVDRILNPLNYINNFASLTSGLAKDLRDNLENEKERLTKETYDDSIELLDMMGGNLEKISEHGFNTVRIVKAMEELLKDRRSGLTLTSINSLCRIAIEKVKKTYEKEIEAHSVSIRFEPLTLSLMMEVSAEQLDQVFVALLKNAFYALLKKVEQTRFEPEILFQLKMAGDSLEITVRDNGTGMDESLKKKIFAPFFTTKPTGEAAGIGLYVCREVIQNHHGTIEVESEKGAYTQFVIRMPIYQPKATVSPVDEEEEASVAEKVPVSEKASTSEKAPVAGKERKQSAGKRIGRSK